MRLANLQEFRRLIYTEDSAPSFEWLRAQIKAGKLPGGMIQCNRCWVDLDAYDRATGLRATAAQQQADLAKSPDLEGLL